MALLGFFGCRPEAVDVDSVSIRPTSVELTVGSTYQLSAAVLPSDAPQELEWTSSRPSVANVNASGLVTAVAVGECDITVYASDKSDVCHVRVVDGDPTHPQDPDNPSVGGFDQNGASNAVFTVASGRTVKFSRGNLQYQASTGTWRFAEHQYDYVGSTNSNISSSNSGWIDLFGWGTSGWNSGANTYQPWATSTTYSDYYPGGSYTNNDLTETYANADWGVYNAISNGGNQAGMWRTLTYLEWQYLLSNRAASMACGYGDVRYVKATVNDVSGLIIFPDTYTHPSGVATLHNVNTPSAEFSGYVVTLSEWQQMESAGCIFLPAAGYRNGTEMDGVGTWGSYWSSTHVIEGYAYCMYFYDNDLNVYTGNRYCGKSVRLVME